MKFRKFFAILFSILLVFSLTACGLEGSGNYPNKPIIIVAPSGAGGGWDKTARSISKILSETKLVEKTITVENQPGGGGAVFLADYVTKDAKNDYKLFVNSPPIIINNLKAEGNSPYGYKDTTPLAQLTTDYGAIVVAADSPYQDLNQVIEAIKTDPTKVTVAGGSAPGSMDHLIAVLPAFKSGIDPKSVKYVSYDGGGEAIAALLGKNADVIGTDVSSVGEYLKAGKVRVLATSSPERLGGEFADIPTMRELGIDAEFIIWRGVFGPKQMSQGAKEFWEDRLQALAEKDEWKKELEANGWVGEYKGSAEFVKFLEDQEQLVKEMLSSLGMLK